MLLLKAEFTGAYVEAILVVAVSEIVDVVSRDRVNSIVYCSLVGPGSCASKVGFEGWSSRVQIAHDVSVVGPALSECLLQRGRELLERTEFSC